MKRLCLIAIATLAMVSCGGDNDIKLSDQTGFHQAIEFGVEHGSNVNSAMNYAEFKAARTTIEKYQKAFKKQLGGESYLAYLKCVLAAIDGVVLTEKDIDEDADIIYIREFYMTSGESEQLGVNQHPAAKMAMDYMSRLNAAKDKKEYDMIRAEMEATAAMIFESGDLNACAEFVDNLGL